MNLGTSREKRPRSKRGHSVRGTRSRTGCRDPPWKTPFRAGGQNFRLRNGSGFFVVLFTFKMEEKLPVPNDGMVGVRCRGEGLTERQCSAECPDIWMRNYSLSSVESISLEERNVGRECTWKVGYIGIRRCFAGKVTRMELDVARWKGKNRKSPGNAPFNSNLGHP